VHASVNGVITNMELRPGTYLTPGNGAMALLDSETPRVEGYFGETNYRAFISVIPSTCS
jgi:multidrug resistance efflux pump